MKAIETMYAGTLFRSRLEARWAVFFDELNIKWEYEPQGFEIGETEETSPGVWTTPIRYLPDFFLPDTETWVEVKGHEEALDRDLLCRLVDWGIGLPFTDDSYRTSRGILCLGPIPRPSRTDTPTHALIQHRKGVYLTWVTFRNLCTYRPSEIFGDGFAGCCYDGPDLLDSDVGYFEDPDASVSAAYSAARSARFEHSHREVWSKTSP